MRNDNLARVNQELNALHSELYELYRGRSVDYVQIGRLWVRIDSLENWKRDVGEEND